VPRDRLHGEEGRSIGGTATPAIGDPVRGRREQKPFQRKKNRKNNSAHAPTAQEEEDLLKKKGGRGQKSSEGGGVWDKAPEGKECGGKRTKETLERSRGTERMEATKGQRSWPRTYHKELG